MEKWREKEMVRVNATSVIVKLHADGVVWPCRLHFGHILKLMSAALCHFYDSVFTSFFSVMITSSNGNPFGDTVPFWGEPTGHRWIPLRKTSDAKLWCFFDLRLNKQLNKQSERQWFEMLSHSLWRRHRNVSRRWRGWMFMFHWFMRMGF